MDLTPKQAVDSKRFCACMDKVARTWLAKGSKDKDRELRLAELFLIVEDMEGDHTDVKVRARPPVSPPAAIAYEDPPGTEGDTMTPEQEAVYARRADEAAAAVMPAEDVIRQVIKEHIKPKYNAGMRCFAVPMRWQKRAVTTNHDRWKQMLDEAGIYSNVLEWSYDPRSWQGPAPVPGQSIPMVLM